MLLLILLLALTACNKPTAADFAKLARNGDPVLSPNGATIAYTETVYPENSNSGNVRIVLAAVNEPESHQYICEEASGVGNLVWGPDDSLLFTGRKDGGSNQVWYYDPATEQCHQISDFPVDVDNLQITDDYSKIVFSAEVYYSMDLDATAQANIDQANKPYVGYLWSDPYIRHWDTWIEPDKWIHLFTAPLEHDGEIYSVGEAHDIMSEIQGDSPLRPFGDRTQYSISPDNNHIAFVTQTGEERAWNTNDMIYLATLNGTEAVKCLTCQGVGTYPDARKSTPVWVSESVLLYLGMKMKQSESDTTKLYELDISKQEPVPLTDAVDFSIGSYVVDKTTVKTAEDGSLSYVVYGILSYHAREIVFSLDRTTLEMTHLTKDGSITGLNVHNDGKITFVYSYNSFLVPPQVQSSELNTDKMQLESTQVYSVTNSELLKSFDFVEPEEILLANPLKDSDTWNIQSFLFIPTDIDMNNPPPLILYIHGGPESPWYDGWSFRWNPQLWVAQGYTLLLTNYHGSDSFGSAFREQIKGDWFGQMYEDIKQAKDYVIEKGYADPNRIATAGASFGCNTIMWILGHNDVGSIVNVCHDGVFDPRMSATDTEELFFPIAEFGGFVFDKSVRQKYDERNPSLSVSNWKTPTLFIHGGNDFRIPETHGISAFQALRRQGVESQLLYLPTQSHWAFAPKESVVWHETVFAWLERHLSKE